MVGGSQCRDGTRLQKVEATSRKGPFDVLWAAETLFDPPGELRDASDLALIHSALI